MIIIVFTQKEIWWEDEIQYSSATGEFFKWVLSLQTVWKNGGGSGCTSVHAPRSLSTLCKVMAKLTQTSVMKVSYMTKRSSIKMNSCCIIWYLVTLKPMKPSLSEAIAKPKQSSVIKVSNTTKDFWIKINRRLPCSKMTTYKLMIQKLSPWKATATLTQTSFIKVSNTTKHSCRWLEINTRACC